MKTITINDKQYPTYATVEEADDWFSAQFNSPWINITMEDKAKLLVSATRSIDRGKWKGHKVDEQQMTEFPRYIAGKETDEERLKIACCEEALAIYQTGSVVGADTSGIKSMKVQDTQIEFLENRLPKMFQSDSAYDVLKPYLDQGTRILF